MYIHGSVTVGSTVASAFRVDLYNASQQLIVPMWAFYGSMGTASFASTPYPNPNSTDTDFYIRVWSASGAIHDFELNIDEYVASNNVNNPRPVAPDATGSGGGVSSDEYHFTPQVQDRNDVLTGRDTELWAKLYWPTAFSGGPYPLVVFLHGNHNTCGRALTSPRVDDDNTYTLSGNCGSSPFLIQTTIGTPRNDLNGWFGMKITTGVAPLIVRSLGRLFISNNSGTHTIKIVRANDNVQMGSVSLVIGGQGVRAAYNLYRTSSIDPRADPDVAWTNKIPGMNIKGLFEIAPTDYFLPTASNGSGSQYLNADGGPFNVLLPMCDGDVSNLQGVRVFDRIMSFTGNNGVPNDNPPTQKSTYTVWGANHNFYNTEWQFSESDGCRGLGNDRLFPLPEINGDGSPVQRTTGSASVLAFFRANVGASPDTSFNQNFNPRYKLPAVITSIQPPVRIDRGHTPSPSSTNTKVVFDFLATPPPNSIGFATPSVAFTNAAAIREHDYVTNHFPCYPGPNPPPCPAPSPIAQALTVRNITWDTASCDNYFQANWTNSGESITGYQTLDFRVSRQIDQIRNSSALTNFQIQFIAADGSATGVALSLNKYFTLAGPVGLDDGTPDGFLHPILQTVRIPLSDFTGANLSNVRGVRFVFSDTPQGAIYLANIRLSNQP